MAHLIIEQPGVPPMTVEITPPVLQVGRADDNSVILVADEVSRHHARFEMRDGRIILHDLKSMNGTYVNRQRIAERVLNDNDEVFLGSKCRALFKASPDGTAITEHARPDSKMAIDIANLRTTVDDVSARMTMQTEAHPDTPVETTDLRNLRNAVRRLDALYKATQLISSDFDLQARMSQVLDLAIEVTKAERGFLLIIDEVTKELKASQGRQMGAELDTTSPSMTIARKSAIDGESVLMESPTSDSELSGRASIVMQRISSAMCVPLRTERAILGALYVDTTDPEVRFVQDDLDLFEIMAQQSALAIDNLNLYEKMLDSEKRRANFERFLSPAIVQVLMNQDQEVSLGGRKQIVTILFCDIRGFTPLSEGLEPGALVDLLNEHFTAMTEIVFNYRGTLDKFIGDEVMALFGAPFASDEDPVLATKAGLEMQQRNTELNIERNARGMPSLEIGVGINTGEVFSGYIGSPRRLDFSVIGDHVNVGARLCSVAKGGQVIIGEATQAKVKDEFELRDAGVPVLKGKSESVNAYEVLALKNPPLPTAGLQTPSTA